MKLNGAYVPKRLLNNAEVSVKAKGLYTILAGLQNKKVSLEEIGFLTKMDSSEILQSLKELKKAGYVFYPMIKDLKKDFITQNSPFLCDKKKNYEILDFEMLPENLFLFEKNFLESRGIDKISVLLNEICDYYFKNNFSVIYFFYDRIDYKPYLCHFVSFIKNYNAPIIISTPTYYTPRENFLCYECINTTNLPFCFEESKNYLQYIVRDDIERKFYLINFTEEQSKKIVNLLNSEFSINDFVKIIEKNFILVLVTYKDWQKREQNFYEFDLLGNFFDGLQYVEGDNLFIGRFLGWSLLKRINYRNLSGSINLLFKLINVSVKKIKNFRYILTDYEDDYYRKYALFYLISDFVFMYKEKLFSKNNSPEIQSLLELLSKYFVNFCNYEDLIKKLRVVQPKKRKIKG